MTAISSRATASTGRPRMTCSPISRPPRVLPGGIATTDGDGDIMFGHYKPETLWVCEVVSERTAG